MEVAALEHGLTARGEFGFTLVDTESRGPKVAVIPMSAVLDELPGRIDLLKCDIEGAEEELFADCSSWLPLLIGVASVECHGRFGQAELLRLVRENGGEADVLHSEATPQFGCETVVFRLS